MKTTPGFECDVCGVPKRDTNHWWKGYLVPRQGSLHPAGLLLVAWDVVVESDQAMHLCGELCASKKLSEVMAKPPGVAELEAVPVHRGFGDDIALP